MLRGPARSGVMTLAHVAVMSDQGADHEAGARPVPRYYPEFQAALETMPPGQQIIASLIGADLAIDLADAEGPDTQGRDVQPRYRDVLVDAVNAIREYLRGQIDRADLAAMNARVCAPINQSGVPTAEHRDVLSIRWARVASLIACVIGELDTTDPLERARFLAVTLARCIGMGGEAFRRNVATWWHRMLGAVPVADGFVAAIELPSPEPDAPDRLPLHRPEHISINAWPLDDPPNCGLVEMIGGFSFTSMELYSAFEYHFDAGRHDVIVDMVGVRWLNDLDLGTLPRASDTARNNGGDVVVVLPRSNRVYVVLEMLGLVPMLHPQETIEDARAFVAQSRQRRPAVRHITPLSSSPPDQDGLP